MENDLPELKVYMLGKFFMVYGDKTISFRRSTSTKALKLLQILLHNSGERGGIPRNQLLEDLFGREEVSDAANNLRVTVHRLKKILSDTELPEYDYILIENGIYKWDSPMETWVDVNEFTRYVKAGEAQTDKDRSIEYLKKACFLYRGEFLPALSGEDWVIMCSVAYKEQYSYALEQVCEDLKRKKEYEEMLELSSLACEIYPFDEWQAVKIEALMGLNRYKEAIQFYDETSKFFFEELGITPSERLLDLFSEMSSKMTGNFQAAGDIQERLKEQKDDMGAFFCSLPSFRDGYRLIQRIIERNGQSVFLMILTLTDGKGHPVENAAKRDLFSEELYQAIKKSLRRGDSFTKYSTTQFLILLVGTNRENCSLIFRRIADTFSRDHRSWRNYLEYYVSSVADVENDNSRIRFKENEFHWS